MTITFNVNFKADAEHIWAVDPKQPMQIVEGQSLVITCTYLGETTVTSPTAIIYRGATNLTATLMTGSASASGNVVTLPTIAGLIGNSKYTVAVSASDQLTQLFQISCIKDESRL